MRRPTRYILIAVLLFSLHAAASAQNFKGTPKKVIDIAPPERTLTPGESLEYSVLWLGFDVGTITLKVEEMTRIRGRLCYHLSARAFPNDYLKGMYDIEFNAHSYLDRRTLCPLRFERTRRINKDTSHMVIDFFPARKEAVYTIDPSPPVTITIPKETQDVLSLFYYFRLRRVRHNATYTIDVCYEGKNWQEAMRTKEPFMKELFKQGAVPAIEIESESGLHDQLFGGTIFTSTVTVDSRHLPVGFKLQTGMGPATATIKDLSRKPDASTSRERQKK